MLQRKKQAQQKQTREHLVCVPKYAVFHGPILFWI